LDLSSLQYIEVNNREFETPYHNRILINFTEKILYNKVIENVGALIISRKIYFLKLSLCSKPLNAIFELGCPSCQLVHFNSLPLILGTGCGGELSLDKKIGFSVF
jgi:hypothetical protein